MDSSESKYKTGAVVVFYNPTRQEADACLSALLPQVDMVYVADNSACDNSGMLTAYGQKLHYVPNMRNEGIAAAQNKGVAYLKEQGFQFVLFSDQDSCSPQGLVAGLLRAYGAISKKHPLSAVGPLPVNKKTGNAYLSADDIVERCSDDGMEYYITSSIMSSYSLVPLALFDEVGMFDESLFIDFVELEWFWRAASRQRLCSAVVPELRISHELGVAKRFLGMNISVSSAFRIYYQTRNLLWMARVDYVPAYWKRKNLLKLAVKFVYYPLCSGRKGPVYLARMIKGLCDGLRKKQ